MNVLFSGITFTMILLPIIYRSASMGRHPWFFHQSLKELSTALFQIVVESWRTKEGYDLTGIFFTSLHTLSHFRLITEED